jgi:AsmA protein
MGGILKVLGIVVGALVVLLIAVMIGVSLFFDPNDYKDRIAAGVEQATGRALALEGDLELEVFPRLRIAVGAAELANAPGFGGAPFARIDGARLQLGLVPLLFQRIEIDEARLEGLILNLARNAAGQDNWQDLGAGGAPAEAEPADAPEATDGGALELDVGAIVIENAAINWSDAAAGSDWQLASFDLEAAGFGPDVEFPLNMSFSLAGEAVEVAVEAEMNATLGLAENRYRLTELDVELAGEGSAWPGGAGEATVSFGVFDADLEAETVTLEDLALEILGINVSGDLTGQQLLTDLRLAGAVQIETFDPQDLLELLEIDIETADPDVLRRVEASARLAYDANRMMLEALELGLDDSRMVGELGVRGEALSFDLQVDSINIDRYLPPASEETAEEEEGSLDEVDLPLQALRDLNASGRIAFGEAQFIGLTLSDAALSLSARNGRVVLQPSASLYGGGYSGEVSIRVGDDAADLALEQGLDGVDMGALGRDLLDADMVSGTGDARLNLTATGSNLGEVRRQLDGEVSFALADGAWEGVDMWYELRRARALFDSRSAPNREGEPRTEFSEVSVSGVVEDAILTTRSLTATLPFMAVTGSGTVNLLTDAMDLDLTARIVDGPTLQSDPDMVDLAGDELPLSVGGTLSAPSVLPDFGAMIRAEAEERVEEAVEERTEELRDRLQDRLRGIFDR